MRIATAAQRVVPLLMLCVLEGVLARSASAQLAANGKSLTVTTSNAVATFAGPDLVGFVNALTGESYLTHPSTGELATVNTMTSFGQPLQASNWTIGPEPITGHPLATTTGQDSGRMLTLTVKVDPVSQEIVLRLSASTSPAGLWDAAWSIAGLNLDTGRLILPSDTGIVLDRAHPNLGPWALSYPYNWHAQMAVYEAAHGSFVVYSTDTQMRFKRLRTSTRGSSTIDVALATEAVAPVSSATAVQSIEWRLKAFNGDWRASAGAYRDWLWANRPPVSNAAHPWVSNIRAVVGFPSDASLLPALAAVVNPSQTLLYVFEWRQVPFGLSLPDYTPRAGVASFISAAHALGFKVMLHFDSLGVTPSNPDYAAVKQYQARTADSLDLLGWNWGGAPSAPGSYAFINPAAPAWRNLLISRMTAGLQGLGADAIHLDLSSSLFNDGNGLIGGLNYAQGMAQLHQEIIAAFPAMAIGGEGQTDVTYRYQSFAQSWWLPDGPTEGHPLVSFLFGPQVLFYGHLGQTAARNASFRNWMLQLQRRAILPQVKVWDSGDLDPAHADNARLFSLIQSWQSHAFKPAWTADWTGALVRHEGLAGSTAALTDSGTLTTLTAAGTTLFQIAHDVGEISTPSTARNWPAFDATTTYGLDPANRYFLDPVARPVMTHVTSLPSGLRLGPGTLVGPGFAHVEVLAPRAALFDFDAASVASILGVRYQGTDWPLANGAVVVSRQTITAGGVARSGFFIHPPWQGQVGGETFAEFLLPVPSGGMLQFSVGVADNATCTDGVTFRVTAGGTEIWRQHVLRTGWQDALVNLASYSGATVPVRFVSNPGPAGNSGCDWSVWSGAKLVVAQSATPITVPLALSSGSVVSGFDGNGTYASTGTLTGTVTNFTVPGQFTLFTQNGVAVSNGTNLAALPFQQWIWAHGDIAEPGAWTNAGSTGPVTIGGVTKNPGIWSPPPEGGATRYSWLVRLPNTTNLRLGFSAGIIDNAFTADGVEFVVRVNGVPYWRLTKKSIGWTPGSLDLSQWRGQNVLIDLATDSLATLDFDWSAWGDLVLSTSGTACSYSIPSGASVGQSGGTFSLNVTATSTCAWNAVSSAPSWLTPVSASGSSSGTVTYTVGANPGPARTATLTLGGQTFTITQSATPPTMTLDKTLLRFGAISSLLFLKGSSTLLLNPATSPQIARLTQSGTGPVSWTATANQWWVVVNPSSGSGSADLTFSLQNGPGPPFASPSTAVVTVVFTGATNATATIEVTLNHFPASSAHNPFGVVDTPLDNTTGVTGAVPFTGWALDDVEVTRVMVCRAAFGGEVPPVDPNCGGAAQIFVGFGTFIDGARTDVQAAYPTYPMNSRGGWGFMVLTNMLPNQGNGTYQFFMYAQDRDGQTTLLGTRMLTCANESATKPFGAIDTPTQGGPASGTSFINFGWALTPQPKIIPINGSSMTVMVDGAPLGAVDYNHERPDIEALFPGFQNTAGSNGGVGFRVIDTTTLTNGLHTISWTVTDNQGVTEGIGSRFFTVANGSGAVTAADNGATSAAAARTRTTMARAEDLAAAPQDDAPVLARRGWDLEGPWRWYGVGGAGRAVIRGEEVDRFELWLGAQSGAHYSGYLRVGDELAPLPVGSQLESATGQFTWAPGVGFVGRYDLVFVRWEETRPVARHEVRIVLAPKGSGHVGVQVAIDTPRSQQDVGQPFVLAGWAADLDAAAGTGIDTLHVWAYPAMGGAPVFLGTAALGGARPDVAAVHGDEFRDVGFTLSVQGLSPGTYDLAVFPWSNVTGTFAPARTVRVRLRP